VDEQFKAEAREFFSLMKSLRRAGADSSPSLLAQLSPALLALLEEVADRPDVSIVELAGSLGRAVSTTSIEVRRLEKMGMIKRQRHPSDGRSVLIRLTPNGEELVEIARETRCRTVARLLSALTSEERQTLIALLGKALAGVNNDAPGEERSC